MNTHDDLLNCNDDMCSLCGDDVSDMCSKEGHDTCGISSLDVSSRGEAIGLLSKKIMNY